MKDFMVQCIKQHLETALRVKSYSLNKIDVDGFINTLIWVATLDRDITTLEGYDLRDYKLDQKFKAFVMPRGIYTSSDMFALDIRDVNYYKVNEKDGAPLNPADFKMVQAEIISAVSRNSAEYTTDLLDASMPKVLSEVLDKVAYDGKCNYHGEVFMPYFVKSELYKEFWYNFDFESMFKQLVIETFKAIK